MGRFLKIAHFVACHKTHDVTYIAEFYFKEIIRLHGVPKTIVYDHQSKFVSHFLRSLWSLLGTKILLSAFYHPQIDGQTEVTNRTVTTLFRTLISKSLKDWDLKLPYAKFACNKAPSHAIVHSSFECVYADNPLNPMDLLPPTRSELRVSHNAKLSTR